MFTKIGSAQLVVVAIIAALLLVVLQPFSQSEGFRSSEVAFTDPSPGGFAIIPASCPSSPHYDGECDIEEIPGRCGMRFDPWVVAEDEQTTLTWRGPIDRPRIGNVTYISGVIVPTIGAVGQEGSRQFAPTENTTFVYRGTYEWSWGILKFERNFECQASVTVIPKNRCPDGEVLGSDGQCHPGQCPDGEILVNGQCEPNECPDGQIEGNDGVCRYCPPGYILDEDNQCTIGSCPGTFLYCGSGPTANIVYERTYTGAPACSPRDRVHSVCRYGCVSGACKDVPTAPASVLRASPLFVRRGETTVVSWSTTDMKSCTVTGTNGDSWGSTTPEDGLVGNYTSRPINERTVFTQTCIPRGVVPVPPVVKTVTVNIIPEFEEQ